MQKKNISKENRDRPGGHELGRVCIQGEYPWYFTDTKAKRMVKRLDHKRMRRQHAQAIATGFMDIEQDQLAEMDMFMDQAFAWFDDHDGFGNDPYYDDEDLYGPDDGFYPSRDIKESTVIGTMDVGKTLKQILREVGEY